jgi:predicted membrane protein
MGALRLDLTDVQLEPGDRLDIHLTAGIGEITVYVPDASAVEIRGRANVGDVDLLDQPSEGGIDVDRRTSSLDPALGVFVIDAEVGIGSVRVERTRDFVPDPFPGELADSRGGSR